MEESQLYAVGEYSRTVHAEMDAILTAARTGVSVREARMYTTTFPCHNCVRHMIAAGIATVVFVFPFEKSLAHELHADAVADEGRDPSPNKIVFERFVGIAPRRYADFYAAEKDERKDDKDQPALTAGRKLKKQFAVSRDHYVAAEEKVIRLVPKNAAVIRALDETGDVHNSIVRMPVKRGVKTSSAAGRSAPSRPGEARAPSAQERRPARRIGKAQPPRARGRFRISSGRHR